jgi:hypothetical protein
MTFEVLAFVVFLNVLATMSLWRKCARKPPVPRAVLKALLWGGTITPRHERPRVVGDKYPRLANDYDRRFFADFRDFADVVNWWLAGDGASPWRLQELPDTALQLDRHRDGPSFGRRYSLFHNTIRVGTLELSPGLDHIINQQPTSVHTHVQLKDVRLLPFRSVMGLLTDLAMHLSSNKPPEALEIRERIHFALTRVLWQAQQIPEVELEGVLDLGEIDLRVNGSANWYFVRREAMRNQTTAAE